MGRGGHQFVEGGIRRLAPSAGMARLAGVLVVPLALAGTATTVIGASYSSFTAQTSSPAASWDAGSVALSNDAASALFTATGLKPGSTANHCVTVSSTGSLPASVKLYATGYATTAALSSFITLSIVQGTGGSFGSCTGFTPLSTGSSVFTGTLAAFKDASTYGTGLGTWTTAGVSSGSETRTYQISYTVDPQIPNTSQNGTASVAFTWEAQNT